MLQRYRIKCQLSSWVKITKEIVIWTQSCFSCFHFLFMNHKDCEYFTYITTKFTESKLVSYIQIFRKKKL